MSRLGLAAASVACLAAISASARTEDPAPAPWAIQQAHAITALALSPDGRTVLTGDEKGVVRWFDAASAAERGSFKAQRGAVVDIAFAASDPEWLVTLGDWESIRVWDFTRQKERRHFDSVEDRFATGQRSASSRIDMAVSAKSKRIAVALPAASFLIWDCATGREFFKDEWGYDAWRMTFSPDGTKLALVKNSGKGPFVALRSQSTWKTLWTDDVSELDSDAEWKDNYWSEIRFSPDGKDILLAGQKSGGDQKSGAVRCLDATKGTRRWTTALPAHVAGAAESPDGKIVAVPAWSGGVTLLSASTGEKTVALGDDGPVWTVVAFSPDGAWLYAASNGGEVRRWDSKSLK